MKLSFSIALRFLRSNRLQTFFIVLGIAVGVSVQVFIGSLISGLQLSLVDTTIGNSSQITVSPLNKSNYIADYVDKMTTIENSSQEILVVSPNVDISANLVKNTTSTPIILRGFQFEEANQIYKFDEKLLEGGLPTQDNEIVLGSGIKDTLDLSLGDTIELQLPTIVGDQVVTTYHTLHVVGFFDFNVASINNSWALSTLETAQSITQIGNQVTGIEMQISDVFEAEVIANKITNDLNDDSLTTDNWMSLNESLLSGLQGQSISSIMIQVFVLISVVLGIASVLAITVMQKSKQIGILKAMGIKDKDSSLVFLFEGLILGFFGAIGGVLLGLGLAISFTIFAVGPDGQPIIPLFIDPLFIAGSAVIAVVVSMIASLFPAIKSSKLSVIEVIRNG